MADWISIQELSELLGIGRTKYYDLVKLDDFPKPNRKLGPRSTRYSRSEITKWMEGAE